MEEEQKRRKTQGGLFNVDEDDDDDGYSFKKQDINKQMFNPKQQTKKMPNFLDDDEDEEDTFVPLQKPKTNNLFNDNQMSIKSNAKNTPMTTQMPPPLS